MLFRNKKIRDLEEIIEIHDHDYNLVQTRLAKSQKECSLLREENERLTERNEELLSTISKQRIQIVKLEKEIKELLEKSGDKNDNSRSKKRTKSIQ